MRAAIVEEAIQALLRVKLHVGMRTRNGRIGSSRLVSKGHVILSGQPPVGVDDLRKASQVDALLLQVNLLLLGDPGKDGQQNLHRLCRALRSGSACVVHIKAARCDIRRKLRYKCHLDGKVSGPFHSLVVEESADVARESVGLHKNELKGTSKRGVGQKDVHLKLRIGKHLSASRQGIDVSTYVVEHGAMNLQQFTFLVGR